MIQESRYWKMPLLRAATWLERVRLSDDDSAERSLVRIERELFMGFYGIRKLLETFTVSLETKSLQFQLQWSPCVKLVDHQNAHRIDELFDLAQSQTEHRDLGFLCNQFIHSFVFVVAQNEDGSFAGAFISSDRSRHQKVYFVEVAQILLAFRTVGRDYPNSLHLRRNEETHQWEQVPSDP